VRLVGGFQEPGGPGGVARGRETFPWFAWLAVVCGPGAQDVPALRLARGRVWPAGARPSRGSSGSRSCVAPGPQDVPAPPDSWSCVARGRETYRPSAHPAVRCGPPARNVPASRLPPGRLRPRGRKTYRPSAHPAVMCGPRVRKVPADAQNESTGTRSQRRPPPIPPAAASPAVTVADEVAEPSSPLLDRPPTESPLAVPPR